MEVANAVGAASLAEAFGIEVTERKREKDRVSCSPFAREEMVQKVLCEW